MQNPSYPIMGYVKWIFQNLVVAMKGSSLISCAKYFPEPQISVSNKCLKFDLLGRKARSEQCWSSQDKTVRNNSSVEEVDTDALYDSNNGRIIMLNCGTC